MGQPPTREELDAIDWPQMTRKLAVLAYALLSSRRIGRREVVADAMLAEDLVNQAVEKFVSGQRAWDRAIPAIVVLRGIIKSDVSHLLASYERKNGESLQDPRKEKVEGNTVRVELPSVEIEYRDQKHALILEIEELLKGDDKALAAAKLIIEGDDVTAKEIAEHLDVSRLEAYAINKRLKRKLASLRAGKIQKD